MRRNRNADEAKKGSPEWMNTYGDMVTLLLTFFVLLFAMSTIDTQKFEQIIKSIQGSLGINYGATSVTKETLATEGDDNYPELDDFVNNVTTPGGMSDISQDAQDMEKLFFELKTYIDKNNLGDSVEITKEKPGLLIRFKDNVLFDSGKADLKADAKNILKYIAGMLNAVSKDIRVEGHTDNLPIRTSQFQDNWDLSAKRATNVLRYFIEEGDIEPTRLSAVGYGEYHPVAENSTEIGRRQNRRVDIVILKSYIIDEISSEEGGSTANE
ncbi:OmpA family protein [Petroclostridium sp. X23]|uniref:OmpA family protein n=1 Tax=Petroclostridium sp. X23 TaxID=3045146 RepID=UPI0024AD2EF8|nr:OmpA family protein [Petroclostridium sp. X23]WHH58942.1 OmpA family protein [Petroclostridium sp. X23]